MTLATNTYDTGTFTAVSGGTPLEWDGAYSGQQYRGDVTSSSTPSVTSSLHYDVTGNITSATANGITTNVTTDTTNFAVPTQLSAGSLANNFTWNTFLGLTQVGG